MGGVRMAGVHGFVTTKADRIHAIRINAETNKFFSQCASPAFTQRPVVFIGSAFITMAFNLNGFGGIAFQVVRYLGYFGLLFGLNYRAVIVKMNRVSLERLAIFIPTRMTRTGGNSGRL